MSPFHYLPCCLLSHTLLHLPPCFFSYFSLSNILCPSPPLFLPLTLPLPSLPSRIIPSSTQPILLSI